MAVIAALLVIFSVIFGSTCLAQSTGYPRSKGPVSDYAGKLSQAQVAELSSLIQGYERQTSIEITVVVVDSLQGQSAREYATGIGDSWGVGKAGRNNGIVLLWAPNERAYSLRIAEGLSQDLGDAEAAEITRSNLVPYFRRGDYYEGLNETVRAVMRRLGNESWEERRRPRRERSESLPAWLIPSVVAGLGISTVLLVAFYRRRKRYLKVQEMAAVPGSIAQSLGVAQQNGPQIQQLLDDFKKEMPEQDLTRLVSELADQPNRIGKIKADLAKLNVGEITSYQKALLARDCAEAEANLLDSTQQKLGEIRQAKAQSQLMMHNLSKESFEIAEIRDRSRRGEVDNLLSSSRLLYNQAHQNSSMSLCDWMMINELLDNSQRQVQQAVQVSQAAPYVPPPPVYDANSTFGSGTSSVGSGGFGSGGGFGGGGGFSGGSGSDGSY